jgi:hypothetical protein
MPNLDPVSKIKEYLTPSLVTIVGVMLWSQLTELKADVKQLLINQSADQVKIANLEQDVEELKSNYLSHELASFAKETAPNRVAKKEEGPEVPTGE